MENTYILTIQAGLRIAVRQRYQSWRGTIMVVTKTTVSVRMDDGSLRRFAPGSKLEVGTKGHKWMRPYICTVAEADEWDRKHRAAVDRAGTRIETGTSPSWDTMRKGVAL